MERNQKPPQPLVEKEQEHFLPQLAVLPDASHDANAPKLSDQEKERAESEQHISASPPADSGAVAAQFSEDQHAKAVETIKSARSSRSDTMYDQTPPDFDVRIDKPLSSRICPLDILLGVNGDSERSRSLLMMKTMDLIQL
jgi:hypothetical protein